jgi:hypothetical protein
MKSNLEGDDEVKDVEDKENENDSDIYDLDQDQNHEGVDLCAMMNGMRDLKMFMTHKFDSHEVQFQEMRTFFQRWDNLGASPSEFFIRF